MILLLYACNYDAFRHFLCFRSFLWRLKKKFFFSAKKSSRAIFTQENTKEIAVQLKKIWSTIPTLNNSTLPMLICNLTHIRFWTNTLFSYNAYSLWKMCKKLKNATSNSNLGGVMGWISDLIIIFPSQHRIKSARLLDEDT